MPVSYYVHTAEDSDSLFIEDSSFRQAGEFKTTLDFSQFSIGLGYQFPVSDNAIVTFDVNYLQLKVKAKGSGYFRVFEQGELVFDESFSQSDSETENGFSARAMYRNSLTENFQFNLGLQHSVIRFDGDSRSDTAGIIEGLYHFNEEFSVKLSGTVGEDQLLVASVRYSF